MKRKMMMFGVVLILGLLALGCGNPAGGGGDNPYDGTTWSWPNGDEVTFANDSEWVRVNDDDSEIKGTYTYSGSSITAIQKQERDDSGEEWVDVSGEPEDNTFVVTIAGRTMVTEIGEILTLKDAGPVSGGPYVGSAWAGTYSNGKTVLIFPDDNNWLMIHTNLNQARRGTYTYSDDYTDITLNWTSYSKDFGATWSSYPSELLNGTVSNFSTMALTMNMQNVMFTKQ